MRSETASVIVQVLDVVLEKQGFVRNGLNWYRYGDESILIINVQRAQFAPGPYINLGVYFHRYGEIDDPQLVDCHVRVRLTRVVPNALREIQLLDLTNEIPEEVRRDELQDLLRASAIPWLESVANFESARSFLAANPKGAYVLPEARADLLQQKSSE